MGFGGQCFVSLLMIKWLRKQIGIQENMKDNLEEPEVYDFAARQREKQLSREKDAEDIRTGKRTKEQVQEDNDVFGFGKLAREGRLIIDWDSVRSLT